jgi:hypothetical protein
MKLSRAIPAITLAVAQNVEATSSPVIGFPPSPNPAGSSLGVRSPYTGSVSWQLPSSHSSSVRKPMRRNRHAHQSGSQTHSHHFPTHTKAHIQPSHSSPPHSPSTNLNADSGDDDGVEIDIVPGGWTNPTGDQEPKVPTAEIHPIAGPSSDGVGTEPPSDDGWRDASMTWYNGSVLEE